MASTQTNVSHRQVPLTSTFIPNDLHEHNIYSFAKGNYLDFSKILTQIHIHIESLQVQKIIKKKINIHNPSLCLLKKEIFHFWNPEVILIFFKTLKGAEKSPATSSDVKSDKANFISQESREEAKNPTSTNTTKEAAKEKGGPTSLPLGKLFWKKVSPIFKTCRVVGARVTGEIISIGLIYVLTKSRVYFSSLKWLN